MLRFSRRATGNTKASRPSDQLERFGAALADRYAVERELGRGGMATVYLAEDLKHRRKVAIKVLRPELGAMLGPDRFTREIHIAAGLNHPHIVPLYDSGEAGGLLFYVMPYVRGESLRQKLRRETQLPIEEAIGIARQVASALDHAHAQGLIHRDVKPENILLHEGEAMVTDFGIALAAGAGPSERLTERGLMVGTPAYMSPEQASGEPTLDARSDVYSLGCVLYELLAGEPPYTGPTAQAVMAKRFTDPVPRVRRLRGTVPPAVEQAIMQALARVPADRFASAAAFAAALTASSDPQSRSPSVAVLPFLSLSPNPELYLQGRHCYSRYTEEGIRKGIEYFRQAIAADPGYALAYVGVALAYAEFAAGQGGGLKEDLAYREAMEAVTRALALDSGLGEAHSVLALLKCVHDYDWAGAEREFKLALELSPGAADIYDHYGWLCGALERYDEAIVLVQRAQEFDPARHRADLATAFLRAGRHEEALEAALQCVEFEPELARGRATLGWAYLKNGLPDKGLAQLEKAVAFAPDNALYLAQLGEAYGLLGKVGEAREVLRRLEEVSRQRYVSPYHTAYVYTGLGEQEKAMDLLERAYEERSGGLYGVKGSFLFTTLRSHPRFKALLRKMNLA
jgi:tetratricopeptide (TPR) repeat protein